VLVPSDAYHPSVPTQAPDLEASKDLLDLANTITRTDKESFIGAFNDWYEKYQDILNERIHDKFIKKKTPPYMRPRLHSALEGLFSDQKSKIRIHSGICREHRKKFLDE